MSKAPRPKGHCFVSYKTDSRGLLPTKLYSMCRKLTDSGLDPFLIHSEKPDDIGPILISALRECTTLAYLATSGAYASPWVSLELYHANRLGLSIYKYDPKSNSIMSDANKKIHLPVFPSYSRSDHALVKPILEVLHSFGILIPQDFKPGADWRAEIEDNLSRWLGSGGIIVVFVSEQSLESEWVKYEYTTGIESRQVLPVLLEGTLINKLPFSLKTIQCFEAYKSHPEGLIPWIENMIQATNKRMEKKSHEKEPALKPCLKALAKQRRVDP